MKIHESITLERVEEAFIADDFTGFCISCGADRGECEPDARRYECYECGMMEVYGVGEIIFMLN